MTEFTGGIHPYIADLPIFDTEVQSIAESIREVGLLHPLTLDESGFLIGGRHRLAACEQTGTEPRFEVYTGDPLAFMLHDNDSRKHQSMGQRAAENALTMDAAGLRNNSRWSYGRAEDFASSQNPGSRAYLSRCGTILDFLGRGALESIARGESAFDSIFTEACAKRDSVDAAQRQKAIEANRKREATIREREANDKMLAALTEARSKYLASIQSGDMSIKAAHAAHMADTEKAREDAYWAKKNAEQSIRETCEALDALTSLSHPDTRARKIAEFPEHAEGTRPAAREQFTPTSMRRIASWINTFADELEASR